MKIIKLPSDFNNGSEIEIEKYQTNDQIFNSKVHLLKNVISFVQTGTKEVKGLNEKSISNNNHFFIIRSGHSLMTETFGNNNDNYFSSLLIFFNDSIISEYLMNNRDVVPKSHSTKNFVMLEYDNYIKNLVEGMKLISESQITKKEYIVKQKLFDLFTYLYNIYPQEVSNSLLNIQKDTYVQIKEVIEKNLFNNLSIEELAFLSNMSPSKFRRNFMELYRATPMKWIRSKRMQYATNLLATTDKRPSEIYSIAGYDSYSTFIQAFKKINGTTPKKYKLSKGR